MFTRSTGPQNSTSVLIVDLKKLFVKFTDRFQHCRPRNASERSVAAARTPNRPGSSAAEFQPTCRWFCMRWFYSVNRESQWRASSSVPRLLFSWMHCDRSTLRHSSSTNCSHTFGEWSDLNPLRHPHRSPWCISVSWSSQRRSGDRRWTCSNRHPRWTRLMWFL